MRWPTLDELLELAIDQAATSARVDSLQERVLLGAVIVDGNAVEHVWFSLAPGDFYDPLHAVIWGAVLRLRPAARVELINIHREVDRVPGAGDRVLELARQFISDDAHRTVLLSCAANIRKASAHREAARRRKELAA